MIIPILVLGTMFMTSIRSEVLRNGIVDNSKQKFPRLINYTSDEVLKPVFVFEGVNYDELPMPLNKTYHDCYSDYHRCSRSVSYHSPVCAYNYYRFYYESFDNICEMMFENCQRDDNKTWMFYMGDGMQCQHWTRRTKTNSVSKLISKIRKWISKRFL